MTEIWVACQRCATRFNCRQRGEQHRLSQLAWAKGEVVPDCKDCVQPNYRGVDGVIDHGMLRRLG